MSPEPLTWFRPRPSWTFFFFFGESDQRPSKFEIIIQRKCYFIFVKIGFGEVCGVPCYWEISYLKFKIVEYQYVWMLGMGYCIEI